MNLEGWIKYKGWTKAEFARRLCVSVASVNNWTILKKKPNKNIAFRIEEITEGQVKADELLNLESWKND